MSTTDQNLSSDPQGPRYYVDEALCCAHGQCALIAPELFPPDDDGFCAHAGKGWIPLNEGDRELALAAESACPDAAIRVID